jgi:hypothetical protein
VEIVQMTIRDYRQVKALLRKTLSRLAAVSR